MRADDKNITAFNNQVGSVEALFGADADTAAQTRAEYVYSAYGEVMMKSGDLAEKNNITYSTRYQEGNTGLVSYTYRHYSPGLKKWLSKDPIAESGGLNLYQMVDNMPISLVDVLGLASDDPCCKDGVLMKKKDCKTYIAIGHYNSLNPNKNAQLGEGDRVSAITCFRIDSNNQLEKVLPKNILPNSSRKNNKIFPNYDGKYRDHNLFEEGDETVKDAFDSEMKAAEKEAENQCAKNCCAKVLVILYGLDSSGKSWIKKYLKANNKKTYKEFSCQK